MKPVSTCRECPFAKMVNVGDGDTLPDLVAMACTVAPQTATPTLMSLVGKTGLTARPAWCPLPIVVRGDDAASQADDGPHTLPIAPSVPPVIEVPCMEPGGSFALDLLPGSGPVRVVFKVSAPPSSAVVSGFWGSCPAVPPERTPRQLVALRAEAVHERQLAQRVAARTPCDECPHASRCPYAFAPSTFDGACVAPEGSPWR